ncbi:Unknown protein, partial [Striga hermonthica]
ILILLGLRSKQFQSTRPSLSATFLRAPTRVAYSLACEASRASSVSHALATAPATPSPAQPGLSDSYARAIARSPRSPPISRACTSCMPKPPRLRSLPASGLHSRAHAHAPSSLSRPRASRPPSAPQSPTAHPTASATPCVHYSVPSNRAHHGPMRAIRPLADHRRPSRRRSSPLVRAMDPNPLTSHNRPPILILLGLHSKQFQSTRPSLSAAFLRVPTRAAYSLACEASRALSVSHALATAPATPSLARPGLSDSYARAIARPPRSPSISRACTSCMPKPSRLRYLPASGLHSRAHAHAPSSLSRPRASRPLSAPQSPTAHPTTSATPRIHRPVPSNRVHHGPMHAINPLADRRRPSRRRSSPL